MLAQKLILSYSYQDHTTIDPGCRNNRCGKGCRSNSFGTIAFALAFVSLFGFMSDLGISTAYIKSINEGYDPAKAHGTFVRIQLALIWVVFFIVWLGWLSVQNLYLVINLKVKLTNMLS